MKSRISLKNNQYNLPVGRTGTILREIKTRMFDDEKSYLVKLDGASYNLHFFGGELYFPELNTYNQP